MTNEQVADTYKKEQKRLLNFVRKYLPLAEAEDVLHDVFLQLSLGIGQLRSVESISSWLFKTAMNRIIDLKRKKKPELLENVKSVKNNDGEVLWLEDILPALSGSPDYELMRSVIWSEIEEALDELPLEQKEVFVLHEFEGRSFNEIHQITNEKVNTLISRKRYAVNYLRFKLNYLYKQLKSDYDEKF